MDVSKIKDIGNVIDLSVNDFMKYLNTLNYGGLCSLMNLLEVEKGRVLTVMDRVRNNDFVKKDKESILERMDSYAMLNLAYYKVEVKLEICESIKKNISSVVCDYKTECDNFEKFCMKCGDNSRVLKHPEMDFYFKRKETKED